MGNPSAPSQEVKREISGVETTSDTLTSRAGLALFVKYVSGTTIIEMLGEKFSKLKGSRKGLTVAEFFMQVLCFLFDGTSRHLSHFDDLARDAGYAGVLETEPERLASSHAIKRFFGLFSLVAGAAFRCVLRELFVWRLLKEQPEIIEISIDSMVMDNDEAKKREGVTPTYKKVKGFHPLQIVWNGKIIDGVFRGGKKNGNCGNTVVSMVERTVRLIRERYRSNVTIIIRCDAGFFDQKNFAAFDRLGIGFIASGKLYEDVRSMAKSFPDEAWKPYESGAQRWRYTEWGYRAGSWERFYRAIYTRPEYEEGQRLLDFARPENVIITNIGVTPRVLEHVSAAEKQRLTESTTIIESHHSRGADELPHRSMKDFASETLPFKKFAANGAFYYCILIGLFLFETFKEDVVDPALPEKGLGKSYPTTIRRLLVDVAGKFVRSGRRIVLKVTEATMKALRFDRLWDLATTPNPIRV